MARKAQPESGLHGRRVLITGGSSGIGLASARRLTQSGADVALVARGEEALREAAGSLGPATPTAAVDVADADALTAAFAEAAETLGGLDAVIANAGAAAYGPFIEMEPADYRRTVETTLLGVMNTTHAAIPYLRETGGTIVIVGSVAGRFATPWLSAYTAAKHGVRGFARSLHAELRALDVPVQVALIAPGPVDTPFWARARTPDARRPPKLGGVYRAEDVAAEVVRALQDPRPERMVGGLMVPWAVADALAPGLTLRLTAAVAGAGWRRRDRKGRQGSNALSDPAASAEVEGGLPARPSMLTKLRDRVGAGS